jgi:hypothetical protein
MFEHNSIKRKTAFTIALTFGFIAVAISPALPIARGASVPEAGVNTQPVISWLVANVSAPRIYSLLYDLQNFSTRYVYTINCNSSAEYIVRDYSNSSNLVVQSQYFSWGGLMLRNVIAVLPAANPANHTAYVVGGHYDSITLGAGADPMTWAPGVDDDGSGTVAAMEVARVLSPYRFNATLIFAAWTAEEVGLIGSDYHASSLRAAGRDIGATIGMDMIGNYAGTMGLSLVHDGYSEWIADAMINANNDYGIGLSLTKSYNLAQDSDHASFWNYGYNAIMAAEADFSPNWHKNTDTMANVNITLITKATQAAAATLAEMAGIIPPGYGAVTLDKQAYKPGDFAGITLYDSDLNTNPGVADPAQVTALSNTEPTGETVFLLETGANTGVFTGSVELILGPPTGGKLEVSDGDTLRVEYIDLNPPGLRTVQARVDAITPVISGVYAVPDIDTAVIHWKTNEVTGSTVLYGKIPALGSSASVPGLVLDHSVLLSNLQPGTLYYYDVHSADEAGNMAVADNGGNHYRFMTLNGFVVRPMYGYVGYVKSNDPAGNYFTGPEILSGLGYQGTYRGAVQLDTGASPIPPGATFVKASFDALAKGWEYESTGTWNLRLLNSSIDAGWTASGYTAINGVAVDATVPPTLTYPDLVPGNWNSFIFDQSQYAMLRARVNSGKISFRLDGPPSPPGVVLFKWYTGNDLSSLAPRLRVAYSMTGDMQGPPVTALTANPNPTMSASSTDVSLTVSDVTTGGGNVTYAEYFWGTDPGIGMGVPLLADDGSYDSPTEDSTLTIDLTSMPRGIYTLGFRGRDQSDNWGPVRILILYVGVWDLFPPTLDSLTFTPPIVESGSPVNIAVRVTDDIAVYGVWADLRNPSGVPLGNMSMAYDSVQGLYYLNVAYGGLGTYQVTIWANDTSDKWNTTSGSFDVVDTTSPVIVQKSAVPSPQNYAMTVTFTAWVTDRFLDTVNVAFWDPAGIPAGNFTAIRNGPADDNYSYMRTFMTLGRWTYCFFAFDTSNNPASACGNFVIVDGYPPSFISVTATPPIQSYELTVTVTAFVTDPYIGSVWANVTGPGSVLIGNFSMTRTVLWEDNWTYSQVYSTLGPYDVTVWAYDLYGNEASSLGSFLIIDRTSPVVNSHATPDPAEVFDWVRISATASDVQAVNMKVEVWNPGGASLGNNSMMFNSTSGAFEFDVNGTLLGTYTYSVWALDLSNNPAQSTGHFLVQDTTPPIILLISMEGRRAETYNETTVTIRVTDNFAVSAALDAVTVVWTPSDWVSPTVTQPSAGVYEFKGHLSVPGLNHFIVSAEDTSDNAASISGDWNVAVGQPPVAVAGADQNITTGTRLDLNGSASHDDFGIISYVWRIVGPGVDETIEGMLANYTFTTVGTYTVTLTVFDAADRNTSASFSVSVSEKPIQNAMNPMVILAVALVVIILIAAILLLLMRRKKKEVESEQEEAGKIDEEKEKGEKPD